MFSATYSDDIRRLAQSLLRDPVEIEVARRNAAVESVEQRAYTMPKDQKRALLSHLIQDGDWSQVLVFTRTKHGANRLTKQLQQDGIEAAAIHGNKSQSARTQALADFKNYKVRALVATEVASRGLDIKELPHVVNYELPNVPEDYVHRIGRTGRAGATGHRGVARRARRGRSAEGHREGAAQDAHRAAPLAAFRVRHRGPYRSNRNTRRATGIRIRPSRKQQQHASVRIAEDKRTPAARGTAREESPAIVWTARQHRGNGGRRERGERQVATAPVRRVTGKSRRDLAVPSVLARHL